MTRSSTEYAATTMVPGRGHGPAASIAPLSFWGGYDAATGLIVEQRHPACGQSLAGRVMVMATAKGSSSSSSVLAEAIRNGQAPAAVIMRERDIIVALGCIVASELYAIDVPVVIVEAATWDAIAHAGAGCRIAVEADEGGARIAIHST